MFLMNLLLHLLALPASFALAADYFNPNATGIKLQNGFERVYIQVLHSLHLLLVAY